MAVKQTKRRKMMLSVALQLLMVFFSASDTAALTTDGLSLLALKAAISADPSGILDSWLDSDGDPCAWRAVSCRGQRVTGVSLAGFSLEGYLPSELSLLSSLETLSLPYNRFSGQIPPSIGSIRSLLLLDLSNNDFSGFVPSEVAGLESLVTLDLSSNRLNGTLPPEISGLHRLSGVLNLSYNLFSGQVPTAYGELPVAVSLDLRQNRLSGEIPQIGSLLNQGPTAFAGNPALCGFPLKSPCNVNPSSGTGSITASPSAVEERRHKPLSTIPILAVVIIAAGFSIFVLQWQIRRRRASDGKRLRKGQSSPARNEHSEEIFVAMDESFDIELEELLRASAYVIGKSRSGIMYKVVARNPGPAVAVLRISEIDDDEDDPAEDESRQRRAFEAEAAVIGRTQHPNLVRLRAYYCAPDEKLLIYDHIPNGNLFQALHGRREARLPWAARLEILKGAARGLAYLHECGPRKLVHGRVKSSKILLGDDLRPVLSGFGIGQLQVGGGGGSRKATMRSPATQRGDVHAFGVVMMETATGRRAEAGMEEWVRRAFKELRPLSELVDPALLDQVQVKEEVLAVFHIALGCTEPDPESRPRMRAVLEALDRIGPVPS